MTQRLLARLLLLAGAVIVVGSLLPWHTVNAFATDLNVDGIDSPNNGWVTLVCGVVLAGLGFRMVDAGARPRRTTLAVTALSVAVAVWALLDASNAEDDFEIDVRGGVGIDPQLDRAYGQWVLIAGIVLAVVVALLIARRPQVSDASSTSSE